MSRNAFNCCARDVEKREEQREIARQERRDIQVERMLDQDIKEAYAQESFHGGDFVI